MKRVIYLFAVVALTAGFVSCNNDDDDNFSNAEQDLELRASTLGYSDAASYQENVTEQCELGNHENCDIQTDGTHQVCKYPEHSGTKHDGTHQNGSDHGTHNGNGHSHGNGKHHK